MKLKDSMTSDGYSPALLSIKRYKDKTYTNASLYYLSSFALFFDEPLDKLLTVDYSKEQDK